MSNKKKGYHTANSNNPIYHSNLNARLHSHNNHSNPNIQPPNFFIQSPSSSQYHIDFTNVTNTPLATVNEKPPINNTIDNNNSNNNMYVESSLQNLRYNSGHTTPIGGGGVGVSGASGVGLSNQSTVHSTRTATPQQSIEFAKHTNTQQPTNKWYLHRQRLQRLQQQNKQLRSQNKTITQSTDSMTPIIRVSTNNSDKKNKNNNRHFNMEPPMAIKDETTAMTSKYRTSPTTLDVRSEFIGFESESNQTQNESEMENDNDNDNNDYR